MVGRSGYIRVEWKDLTNGSRQFFSFGILEPAERRQGIGQALLGWSEARLAAIAAELPQDRHGQLFAYTRDRDPGATVLFERNGWQPVARGYDMVRPTLDDIQDAPLPDGIVVRPVTEADRRTVWEAAREAFRDHRDEEEWTEADWETFQGDFPDVSPWVIAFDGDAVAGGILNRIDVGGQRPSRLVAWRPPDRVDGRAVATARPGQGPDRAKPRHVRDLGMTSAALDVDGANPNQAMNLYLSQGFEITTSSIDWRKPLPEAPVASAHLESP